MITLFETSECWKCVEVRVALDALGLEYESVPTRGNPIARAALVRAQGEPPQVPMLVDGGLAVWDRRRILRYLEETYGGAGGDGFRSLPDWMGGVCTLEGGPAAC